MLEALAVAPADASATLPTAAVVMVCESVALVEVALAASPLYRATMPCTPAVSVLTVHAAVRVLPLPTSATAEQPEIATAFAVNATVPVGDAPVTDAVNVTFDPWVAGFAELASAVLVTDEGAATPQASTSTIREAPSGVPVMLIRIRSVVNWANVTVFLISELPVTVASVTHAEPFQPCTV